MWLIVLASLVFSVATSQASPLNCSALYHAAVKHVVNLKEMGCDDVAYGITDCCEISEIIDIGMEVLGTTNSTSGIYEITDVCTKEHKFRNTLGTQRAHCNHDNGGGWTVILKRNQSLPSLQRVSFKRTWSEYEQGFGDLKTEFWYGLHNIHCLTTNEDVELQFDFKTTNGYDITWTYSNFKVDGPESSYTLSISGGQGKGVITSDAMAHSNGRKFTTYDKDYDSWYTNCALASDQGRGGGWWYGSCSNVFLTRPHSTNYWYTTSYGYIDTLEMKVRPKRCST